MSDFYTNVKKNEKVQNLEKTIEWLRNESIDLSKKNEVLSSEYKALLLKSKSHYEESIFWKD